MFSILEPGKHLPPHRGPYNGVLRLHLGLIVPEPREQLGIRVENQVYRWQEGEAVIFDDAYEHEAWNKTPQTRVVLFVDFVKPTALAGPFPQLAAAAPGHVHALHPRGHGQPEGLGEEVLRRGGGAAEQIAADCRRDLRSMRLAFARANRRLAPCPRMLDPDKKPEPWPPPR